MHTIKLRLYSSLALAVLSVLGQPASADQYHYREILQGERAFGLGGAYNAISDDPSGIYYNPAGIMFSMESYFSLSANALNMTEKKYVGILPGQDYKYSSKALIPTFFGFTQNIGKSKWGFAIIVTNSDSIDQEDSLTGLNLGSKGMANFKRKFYRSDTTILVGPAFATEVAKNLTLGLALMGQVRTDKFVDQQYVQFTTSGKYVIQNSSANASSIALAPKLGLQFMPTPKVSFAAVLGKTFAVSGNGSRRTLATRTDANNVPVGLDGTYTNDLVEVDGAKYPYHPPMPWNIGGGLAYFFSKRVLLSADLNYYTGDPKFTDYVLQPVINGAMGGEFYMTENFVVRLGTFTNRSNTPALIQGQVNQLEHVNMLGGTFGLSSVRPGSSITLGTSYAAGTGQGQAIGGTTAIQDVKQRNIAIFLTAGYQL